jgi:hypothetical protein
MKSIHIPAATVYCASMSVDSGSRTRFPGHSQREHELRARYDQATADLDPPLAVVDLDAFDRNAADMARRADGRPIRVATKSIRCRYLIERVLARPGYQGLMCYSLAEALWLHGLGTCDDLLVAYPTVDVAALRPWPRTNGPGGTSRSWSTRPRTWTWWTGRSAAATRTSGSAWSWTCRGARWPASR